MRSEEHIKRDSEGEIKGSFGNYYYYFYIIGVSGMPDVSTVREGS